MVKLAVHDKLTNDFGVGDTDAHILQSCMGGSLPEPTGADGPKSFPWAMIDTSSRSMTFEFIPSVAALPNRAPFDSHWSAD